MGFDFSGYVLRPPRSAPTNSPETADADSGVVRALSDDLPPDYTLGAPDFADVRADQYRTAVLNSPGSTPVEYMFWAENTSNLSLIDDPAWWVDTGEGIIPQGSLTVTDNDPDPWPEGQPIPSGYGTQVDGTLKAVVKDDGFRSIGSILFLVVARGDVEYDDAGWVDAENPTSGRKGNIPYLVVQPQGGDSDPSSGLVTLTDDNIFRPTGSGLVASDISTALGGGLSVARGDTVIEVRYTIAAPRFYWTRNDRYQVRFGWNGQNQRWEPYKGNAPRDLGRLEFDQVYQLSPKPRGLKNGFFLPGNGAVSDSYAMIRLGSSPDGLSTAAGPDGSFLGIGVRLDKQVEEGFDFSLEPQLIGVVGLTNGMLVFNPSYVELHAGKTVWYVNRDFAPESTGVIGELSPHDTLFITPIPSPTDRPLLRVGSRKYLTPILVEDDAELSGLLMPDGQVGVSLSTGKLLFSPGLVGSTDPDSDRFDKHYLGAKVVYDGLSLSGLPQPTTAPAQVVENSGKLYIPDAVVLPDEFVLNSPQRGLGVSGVMDFPDGTGVAPAGSGAPADVRPGGDTFAANAKGRIRQVEDTVGDTIVFTRKGAMSVVVVDREDDLPSTSHSIPKGVCYISREFSDGLGSVLKMSRADLKEKGADAAYFLQASLTPSAHTTAARLYSKTRFVFRFEGGEVLYFSTDGSGYSWNSNTLLTAYPDKDYFTPEEVADSINAAISGTGRAYASNGSVVLEAGDPATGTVEVGWGGPVKDLSGAAKLGFLPGWRAQGGVDNWLPDSGVALGLYRSPRNRGRAKGIPDFKAFDRIEDAIVQESVQPGPFVFFQNPPLQDVAGYSDGVFFNLVTAIEDPDGVVVVNKPLIHYEDILHDFAERRFLWLAEGSLSTTFQQPTTTIDLGSASVIGNSLLNAPGIGGGLLVSEGGAFSFQVLGEDYLLPNDGIPGNAVLITRYGDLALFGGRGAYSAGGSLFTDPAANFLEPSEEQATDTEGNPLFSGGAAVYLPVVREGYRLKLLSGDEAGSYLVESVSSGTELGVKPPFLAQALQAIPWELYRGYSEDVYDPAVVADQVYQNFSHLPDEPFKVNVLSPLGFVGGALTANVEGAVSRGRVISIRFGLAHDDGTNSAILTPLSREVLGAIANNLLDVPGVGSTRFTGIRYSLRVGADKFTPVHVGVFSDPVPAGAVEVLTQSVGVDPAGRIKFADDLLSRYAKARVTYQEEFRASADMVSGMAEYNPDSGLLNIGSADQISHAGKRVYFVEQMITENGLDVSLNPIAGTVGFQQPLQALQSVEVRYYQADMEGRKEGELVEEFLPVFVTKTEATRVNHFTFTFNTDSRTVDTRIDPTVFIGAMIQNFQGDDYILESPDDPGDPFKITFLSKTIPDHVPVQVSYAVLEANGGERSYTVSSAPVYRPPFFLKAGVDSFGLQGNRLADFFPGQLIRLGANCFYVKAVEYFPPRTTPLEERNPLNPVKPIVKAGNVTKVHIFPPTSREVGTRSPGHDVLTVISAGPVTTAVDPDGTNPVTTSAPAGFMQAVPLSEFPFEPVNKGQKTINFRGNLTQFAIAGHILEIGGYPFTIASAELNPEGTYTKITLTAPVETGLSMDNVSTVKLSYRPLYPPGVRTFLPLGPLVDTEGYELVLFGETDVNGNELPGRTLIPNIEYSLDPTTGVVELLEPVQAPLGPGQKLILSHTRLRTLSPTVQDGVVVEPRGFATYLYNTLPDRDNGLLGGLLQATYSFRSPDTYYFRIPTLTSFLAEAIREAVKEAQANQAGKGSLTTTTQGEENWDKGNTSLIWERRHLVDKDRAARVLLDYYNQAIMAFEQITETIDGRFVGDKDGKFRFFVGRGLEWPTPGYEDEITGVLQPKNLWSMVVNEADPSNDLIFLETDNLVEPTAATLVDGVLGGPYPDADRLQWLMDHQRMLVTNDVDDRVAASKRRPRIKLLPVYPYFSLQGGVDFKRMSSSHFLSRLFPTQAKAFFLTYPGIGADEATGDPGIYTYGRSIDGGIKRTTGSEIGLVSNPVLGGITNISDSALRPRRARARVWGYFPDGILQDAFDVGVPAADIVEPCMIVTQLPLSEVPVSPESGLLDVSRLISQGGDLADAEAGDPELALPGFVTGDQIFWGQPDGSTHIGQNVSLLSVFGTPVLDTLHVYDVQFGCLIRFADSSGTLLDNPNNILVGTEGILGTPLHEFPLEQGDTIYVSPTLGKGVEISDPPTIAELREMGSAIDIFRNGFDFSVKPDGRIVDTTLPSFDDPYFFGLKEIFGQKAPRPLSPLEGPVEFVYDRTLPLEFPALLGGSTDDDGDYAIPYLRSGNTELDRLGDASVMSNLFGVFAQSGGTYIYPDEIVGNDGEILDTSGNNFADVGTPFQGGPATKEAGVLMAGVDPFPAGVGEEALRPYDLLLMEVGQGTVPVGAEGLLNVAAVASPAAGVAFLEPPRFVTQTTPPVAPGGPTGSPVRYILNNAIVHVDGYVGDDPQNDPVSGCLLYEYDSNGDAVTDTLVLDFSSITQLALNDGTAAGTGNLNSIWSAAGAKANNKITVRFLARDDVLITNTPSGNPMPNGGDELFRIVIQGTDVTVTETVSGLPGLTALGLSAVFGTTDPAPLGAPFEQNRHIVITGASVGSLMDHLLLGLPVAQGSVQVLPGCAAGDQVVISGVVFTAVNGGAVAALQQFDDVAGSGSAIATATSLAAAINDPASQALIQAAAPLNISAVASAVGDLVGLQANHPGDVGELVVTENTGGLRLVVTPMAGDSTSTWFVPYTQLNPLAAGYRRALKYEYDVAIDIDTYNGWAAPRGESDTAYIDEDRLTFHEVIDFRKARLRGSVHPHPGSSTSLETDLLVQEVTCVAGVSSTINRNVNGGAPLTFIGKTAADIANELAGGTWSSPVGGSIKAVAFEGILDANVGATDIKFSAIPSSDVGPLGTICTGSGFMESENNADLSAVQFTLVEGRVMDPTINSGALARVEPGDVLVVKRSNDGTHRACTKAGTYLVKHAVGENDAINHVLQVTLSCTAGGGSGWITEVYPRVVGWDSGTGVLTVTSTSRFPGVGNRVFICRDLTKLSAATAAEYAQALWSGNITFKTPTTFTLNDLRDATGTPVAATDLVNTTGLMVAGHDSLTVDVRGNGLPDSSSVVGHHSLTALQEVIHGFRLVTFEGPGGAVVTYDATAGQITDVGGGGAIEVAEAARVSANQFHADADPVVYAHVAGSIDLSAVPDLDWGSIYDPLGHSAGQWVAALLPNTVVYLGDPTGPTPGFWAQSGIFLEPSFPTPVNSYSFTQARLVERTAAPYPLVGVRDFSDYNSSGVPYANPESVQFEVRRIRRFHRLFNDLGDQFGPLRYAYEIRRGRITTYSTTAKQFGLVEADGFGMTYNADVVTAPLAPDVWNGGETGLLGTNLGPFNSVDVNIHAGDMFRLLDEDGALIEQVPIVGVLSEVELKLEAPGLQTPKATLEANGGMRFEIWLRQAPVPHEQSAEQLLELITFKEVTRTDADYATERGGYVEAVTADYDSVVNRMRDDKNTGSWASKGVLRGDIVILDPTPKIPQSGERGARPIGDVGAYISGGPQRTGYDPGEPNILDDNRGFYRVTDIDGATLVVDGTCTLAGARVGGTTTDVVFPENATYQPILGYSILPTISGSALTGDGREGQMDLRPTKVRETIGGYETYTGDTHSIRPFSYRIIRPSQLFSDEAVDLVLMNRERVLSWIQELRSIMGGRKDGTYWDFQNELHAHDVGLPNDPLDGLGVLGNVSVTSLIGQVNISPYLNSEDCLSILDRRFWVLDRRLDSLMPDTNIGCRTYDGVNPFPTAGDVDLAQPVGAYTSFSADANGGSSVRPVLPERVDIVLDIEDRFRPTRYAWLAYRTDTVRGTLQRIDLFDEELPKRLAEAERVARLEESVENAS